MQEGEELIVSELVNEAGVAKREIQSVVSLIAQSKSRHDNTKVSRVVMTLPQEIRQHMGWEPGTKILVRAMDDGTVSLSEAE